MNVFVIVVIYNGEKWINQCFGSLRRSDLKLNMIAVNNASSDNSVQLLRTEFPEVSVIESEENLGFGRGNNLGLRTAYEQEADYVFLLNQDAWVEPDTIRKLIDVHKTDPSFGVVSPIQLTASGQNLDAGFLGCLRKAVCRDLVPDLYFGRVEDRVYEMTFVPAAAWLLSKACLDRVGGFNPTFFHYGEDNNYIQRVLYHGMKAGAYPYSVVYHDSEFRQKSALNSGEGLEFKTKLMKYSNPLIKTDINREAKKYLRAAVGSALRLSVTRYKAAMEKYRMYSAVRPVLERNLDLSKKVGPAFLVEEKT